MYRRGNWYLARPRDPEFMVNSKKGGRPNRWNRRNGGRPARRNRWNRRSTADQVLAQGVGAYAIRPFRSKAGIRDSPSRSGISSLFKVGLNARHSCHLGLPRPVGPYTVIRTTKTFSTDDQAIIFGVFQQEVGSGSVGANWTNICAISSVAAGSAISATNNTKQWTVPFPAAGSAFECVPAAMTVQLMNANALQTTSGVVLGTRVNQQLDLRNDASTWTQRFDAITTYFPPRLMSAGKLALRGVESSAYPLNMSEYSDFKTKYITSDGVITNDGNAPEISALSPIIFYQPITPVVECTFVVTIEWRVRFDPYNPAAASHSHHNATPDSFWNMGMKEAAQASHAVTDIVENVASMGRDVEKMYNSLKAPAEFAGKLLGM